MQLLRPPHRHHLDEAQRIAHVGSWDLRDEGGAAVRLMGTTQDITERVEAEQERARLALAVEQTADSIWMQGLDNTVT